MHHKGMRESASAKSEIRRRLAALLATGALAGVLPVHAQAQTIIGISAPMSENFAILGEQIEAGARAAIEASDGYSLTVVDDMCTEEGGAASAEKLISAGAEIVIGYPCIEAFNAAMPVLADEGIPVIAVGLQADNVTTDLDEKGWPLVRLAARSSGESDAAADYLRQAWRGVNFAVIDDGTLYGREFAEAVRFSLEGDNLRPVFTDTYRPQLENQVALIRRLQKAGATHVIIGGDAFDAAVIADDAEQSGVNLTLAGGSALVAPPSEGKLKDGTIVFARPEWAKQPSAKEAVAQLHKAEETAEGYTIPGYAAAQVAMAALESGASGKELYASMRDKRFETAMGPIRFGANGEMTRNLFQPFIIQGGELVPATDGG